MAEAALAAEGPGGARRLEKAGGLEETGEPRGAGGIGEPVPTKGGSEEVGGPEEVERPEEVGRPEKARGPEEAGRPEEVEPAAGRSEQAEPAAGGPEELQRLGEPAAALLSWSDY